MKLLKISFITLLAFTFLVSCSEDDIAPSLEELQNDAFDLKVVSTASPNINVTFKASGSDLSAVTVEILPEGESTPVASNTLREITVNSLNRVSLQLEFPESNIAPSGVYEVKYTMKTASGESEVGSYMINVINNREPVFCTYTDALPAGKTVWVRLYVPEGASLDESDDDIFITGSFGTREGGSDWDGGGQGASPFKFNQIDDTCYEIAMNLQSGDQFKITRGDWPKEMQLNDGSTPSNYVYNGESVIQLTAFNWADLPTVSQPVSETLDIPQDAIQSGKMTLVANLPSGTDVKADTYYVIEEGASSLDNAIQMTAFESDSKLAAAVPKNSSVNYVVVKNDLSTAGVNSFGYAQSATWDGATNPAQVSIGGFEGEYTPPFNTDQLLIVGGATPAGWDNSDGNSQLMTQTAPGKFTFTTTFSRGSGGFLLIPQIGNWDSKIGKASGNFSGGTLEFFASDFNEPDEGAEGSYRLDVDLVNGTYTMTPQ